MAMDEEALAFEQELLEGTILEELYHAVDRYGARARVAEKLGITRAAVTSFLDGPNPTLRTVAKYALAAGVRVTVSVDPIEGYFDEE